MKNSGKKIIFISLLILILSPVLTYLILILFDKLILPKMDIYIEGSKDSWISFAGSIIGGVITMLALYFTMKRDDKLLESNKAREIRPYIFFKPEFKCDFDKTIDEVNDCVHYPISLVVENISNNLVKDLTLEDEKVYVYNEDTCQYDILLSELKKRHNINYAIYTVLLDNQEIIKPHDTYSYQTNFIIDNYRDSTSVGFCSFKVVATYKYRDILDIMEYTHYLEYLLIVNYDINDKFLLFTQDITNKTIKEKKIIKK